MDYLDPVIKASVTRLLTEHVEDYKHINIKVARKGLKGSSAVTVVRSYDVEQVYSIVSNRQSKLKKLNNTRARATRELLAFLEGKIKTNRVVYLYGSYANEEFISKVIETCTMARTNLKLHLMDLAENGGINSRLEDVAKAVDWWDERLKEFKEITQ